MVPSDDRGSTVDFSRAIDSARTTQIEWPVSAQSTDVADPEPSHGSSPPGHADPAESEHGTIHVTDPAPAEDATESPDSSAL